jgi:hypothetical protein
MAQTQNPKAIVDNAKQPISWAIMPNIKDSVMPIKGNFRGVNT